MTICPEEDRLNIGTVELQQQVDEYKQQMEKYKQLAEEYKSQLDKYLIEDIRKDLQSTLNTIAHYLRSIKSINSTTTELITMIKNGEQNILSFSPNNFWTLFESYFNNFDGSHHLKSCILNRKLQICDIASAVDNIYKYMSHMIIKFISLQKITHTNYHYEEIKCIPMNVIITVAIFGAKTPYGKSYAEYGKKYWNKLIALSVRELFHINEEIFNKKGFIEYSPDKILRKTYYSKFHELNL